MALLDLSISVHPSSLGGYGRAVFDEQVVRAVASRDAHSCRFCGCPVVASPQIYYLNGDRRCCAADNLATACPSCVLIQGAGRFTAVLEIVPIWLPEMSQRSLNRLLSSLHLRAYGVGLPLDFGRAPVRDSDKARQILKIWAGLTARRATLGAMTKIRSAIDVTEICLHHDPRGGACPPDLAYGLRFLHRGRFYLAGQDRYPAIVAAWTTRSILAAQPVPPLPSILAPQGLAA